MKTKLEVQGLPFDQDLILHLIRKELQDAKFVNELNRLGFGSSIFAADLGVVILSLVGFANPIDELWEWYFQRLNAYTEQIDLEDNASVDGLAMEFYLELKRKSTTRK